MTEIIDGIPDPKDTTAGSGLISGSWLGTSSSRPAQGMELVRPGDERAPVDQVRYDKHAAEGRNRGNSRNGSRAKTVPTELGPVEVDVPRDRDGSFEPVIVLSGSATWTRSTRSCCP